MKLTFLGTGTSGGVPAVGCGCAVCKSRDARNNRYRASALISVRGLNILIDTPPEMRLSLLRAKARDIAVVLWTHRHADHLHGIDDLRNFSWLHGKAVPCYGSAETLNHIRRNFGYIFADEEPGGGVPRLSQLWITAQ